MAPSRPRRTKGVYALMTTFLFIMVVLFIVLAVIYLGSRIKGEKQVLNDELSWYTYMMDAKNRLLSKDCYGQVIMQDEANQTCSFPPGVIIGYTIEMLAYENCTNTTLRWEHRFSNDDGQEYPYFVPIQSSATGNICPGRLKVIR
jgi:hypothetical protein